MQGLGSVACRLMLGLVFQVSGLGSRGLGVGFRGWGLGSGSEAGSYLRLIDVCITQL